MAYPMPAGQTKGKNKYEDYEVHDAMHTMMRAGEIVKDKKLLRLVKVKAREHADKMRETAARADMLAKQGLISDKAMKKHKLGSSSLEKTEPLASGNET